MRLLVAGSCKSIHVEALEETNSLSRKLAVSIGLAILLWFVGYSVAVVAAEVVAGTSCRAVACSRRVALKDGEEAFAAIAGDDREEEERCLEAGVATTLEVARVRVVRGDAARIAGRDWEIDRRAAIIDREEKEE